MPDQETGSAGVAEGSNVAAYIYQNYGALTVSIAMVKFTNRDRVDQATGLPVSDQLLAIPVPTHILRMGPPNQKGHMGEWFGTREWHEITDPAAIQDPTLILQHEEARALYLALARHFGENTQTVNNIHIEVIGEPPADFLDRLREVVRQSSWNPHLAETIRSSSSENLGAYRIPQEMPYRPDPSEQIRRGKEYIQERYGGQPGPVEDPQTESEAAYPQESSVADPEGTMPGDGHDPPRNLGFYEQDDKVRGTDFPEEDDRWRGRG